jgi:hypothetical protein
MGNTDWMRANYTLRHLRTPFAVHGFHHKICRVKTTTSKEKNVC